MSDVPVIDGYRPGSSVIRPRSTQPTPPQVIAWIKEWVDTGEDRFGDSVYGPAGWGVYAGWLDVDVMPPAVRAALDSDGNRWPDIAEEDD